MADRSCAFLLNLSSFYFGPHFVSTRDLYVEESFRALVSAPNNDLDLVIGENRIFKVIQKQISTPDVIQ